MGLESLSPEAAKEIVLRHVVTAKVPAADVSTGSVATIGGEEIELVKTEEGGVQVNYGGNTVNVVAADVAVGAGSFSTLVKIVSDLGLVDTLKNAEALTVFAPSDEALPNFQKEHWRACLL